MTAPFPPLAIANYLVKKSQADGTELTPMKLVKLVYIAHGWHLALSDGEPLLTQGIQAWKYGPVVPDVYHTFKKYGNSQVLSQECEPFTNTPVIIDNGETTAFLDKIWEVHKTYNGVELSSLTHQKGTPWDKVWNEGGGHATKFAPIPNNIIQEYYLQKSKR